jgi:hypothetical protein
VKSNGKDGWVRWYIMMVIIEIMRVILIVIIEVMRDIMMVIIVVLKEMKKGMGNILVIYIVVWKIVLMRKGLVKIVKMIRVIVLGINVLGINVLSINVLSIVVLSIVVLSIVVFCVIEEYNIVERENYVKIVG